MESNYDEYTYVLDGLPNEGERVICHGNKTICCEEDMEESAEHMATYHLKESSWREDKNGNKYDIKTYHSFEIDDEAYHIIFVSRWKRIQ